MDKGEQIKKYALQQLGIDLIGFCRAEKLEQASKNLEQFIDKGYQGGMKYLENYQLRGDPQGLLPGARTVIVIGMNYYREKPVTPPGHGIIARYAWGRDYHKVLKKTLKELQKFLEINWPGNQHKICTDSAPLMEKAFAEKAGIGFYGKNTMLINPRIGSFFLLGELLTSLELEPDQPGSGTCGNCTRCLDACPTRALVAPGQLDARRCISYLTIENKENPLPPDLAPALGNRIFGCDLCQEVCPYNLQLARPIKQSPARTDAANSSNSAARPLVPGLADRQIAGDSLPLNEIMAMDNDQQFLQKFAGSPLMRAKRKGLQRNAANAVINARTPSKVKQGAVTVNSGKQKLSRKII